MRERPILFKGEMVRAILDGRKTQTRRVVKPEPEECPDSGIWYPTGYHPKALHYASESHFRKGAATDFCPLGQPGDRLWVRETWCAIPPAIKRREQSRVNYRASDPVIGPGLKWRPSIHMPRWASRITLEITSVRVERLQEISDDDVLDEGFKRQSFCNCEVCARGNLYCSADRGATLRDFVDLWDTLAKEGTRWSDNPFVWVIAFRKLP